MSVAARVAALVERLDDIRDERHFPAHMMSAHDEMLDLLTAIMAESESAFKHGFLAGFRCPGGAVADETARASWQAYRDS